jgi:hypothetical protein
MMMQMPGIVSNFLYEGRNELREFVTFLKVHHEPGIRMLSYLFERCYVSFAIYRYSDDIGAIVGQELYLLYGRLQILRPSGTHALDRNLIITSDAEVSYPDHPGSALGYTVTIRPTRNHNNSFFDLPF